MQVVHNALTAIVVFNFCVNNLKFNNGHGINRIYGDSQPVNAYFKLEIYTFPHPQTKRFPHFFIFSFYYLLYRSRWGMGLSRHWNTTYVWSFGLNGRDIRSNIHPQLHRNSRWRRKQLRPHWLEKVRDYIYIIWQYLRLLISVMPGLLCYGILKCCVIWGRLSFIYFDENHFIAEINCLWKMFSGNFICVQYKELFTNNNARYPIGILSFLYNDRSIITDVNQFRWVVYFIILLYDFQTDTSLYIAPHWPSNGRNGSW